MIMDLKLLEKEFRADAISKEEYILKMHDIHKLLFDYSKFINNRDIKRIEIEDNRVKFTSKNDIQIIGDEEDLRTIPLEILNFGSYEKDEIDLILNIMPEDSTILDIGANIGWYSLNFSKRLNKARIFAFEPIPQTFKKLDENISINNAINIETFNLGLSNEKKDLIFYYYPEGTGNSSLVNLSERKDVKKVICKVNTLDNFVNEQKISIDFIKCDVEGAELFVFKGGLKTIERDKPIIFTELLRKWASKFDYHPNEVIKMLEKIGYVCFTIKGTFLMKFHEMDENTLETNFLFLHNKKHSNIIERYAEKSN